MANKNKNLIIAYFPNSDEALTAAEQLKDWDKVVDSVKLGGIGIITEGKDGKLRTHKVGVRAGGTGAKWGTILGVAAGILSGGVTVIGGAVVGLAAGSVAGALFRKKIGMGDDDKERLQQHLKGGGAALAVMADDDEVSATEAQLATLGGNVESYHVPEDTVDELEAAAIASAVEEADEAILVDEDVADDDGQVEVAAAEGEDVVVEEDDGSVAEVAAVAAMAAVVEGDEGNEVVEVEDVVIDEEIDGVEKAAAVATMAAVAEDDDGNEVVEAEESLLEAEAAREAILHYHRHANDYDGWGLHVWSGYDGQVTWEHPIPPSGMDDFGIYFTVPLAEDATKLGYIIHRWDEKDLWEDQLLDAETHGYEVWIVQNTPGYSTPPAAAD